MKIPARRLIVAYGNEMHGDDGAAWELARRAAAQGWPALCASELEVDLVELLHGLNEVIFVDATHEPALAGFRPLTSENEHDCPVHCAAPARLLKLCLEQYGQAPLGWVLTLPGEDFGYRLGLSDRSLHSVTEGLNHLNEFFPRQTKAAAGKGYGE